MRAKYMVIGVVVGGLLSLAAVVLAGSLDPPSGPTDAASQMYSLEQIYDRLDTGAVGTKMASFTSFPSFIAPNAQSEIFFREKRFSFFEMFTNIVKHTGNTNKPVSCV